MAEETTSRSTGTKTSASSDLDGRRTDGRHRGGLAEFAREHLFAKIVAGQLRPGTIIQISAVAAELKISRTPAREALVALQRQGLVSVVPNQGYLVNSMSVEDVRDIYVMREVLEAATASRSAARRSQKDLDAFRTIAAESDSVATNGYSIEFDRVCHRLHQAIADAADSDRLALAVRELFDDSRRLQSVGINPPDVKTIVEEHAVILAAIENRDREGAEWAMRTHIRTLRSTALDYLFD